MNETTNSAEFSNGPADAQKTPAGGRRVLVIKLSAFGDFISAFGIFAAIRKHHPTAEITLLTTAPFTGLAEKSGWFDHVWPIRRWRWHELGDWLRFARAMRARDFNAVYNIQAGDRVKIFRLLSPARTRAGWADGGKRKNPDAPTRPVPSGLLDTTDVTAFPVPDMPWLDADLSKYDITPPFVLLVPGAAPQHPGKRWPVAHYAALAKKLRQAGYTPVALGAAAETALAADLTAQEPAVVNLCNKTSFADIAALARRAAGVIGNDTGAMHLTAAVGCPTLVLFSGLSSPARSLPRGSRVEALRGIPIETLTPDTVWEKFTALKDGDGATPVKRTGR